MTVNTPWRNPDHWRTIPGTDGRYEVHWAGQVRRAARGDRSAGVVLKRHLSPKGYFMVSFRADGRQFHKAVHVLVGQAWGIHLPPGYAYALKDDSDRANVSVDNVGVRRIKVKP